MRVMIWKHLKELVALNRPSNEKKRTPRVMSDQHKRKDAVNRSISYCKSQSLMLEVMRSVGKHSGMLNTATHSTAVHFFTL